MSGQGKSEWGFSDMKMTVFTIEVRMLYLSRSQCIYIVDMRLLDVFDVLKYSATEDSTYVEEEEEKVCMRG